MTGINTDVDKILKNIVDTLEGTEGPTYEEIEDAKRLKRELEEEKNIIKEPTIRRNSEYRKLFYNCFSEYCNLYPDVAKTKLIKYLSKYSSSPAGTVTNWVYGQGNPTRKATGLMILLLLTKKRKDLKWAGIHTSFLKER